MVIGVLQIDLFMPDAQSLKEKRMILKSLKARLRNNFNLAVSELDHHEKWQRTRVGIVSIGNERRAMEAMVTNIVEFINRNRAIEVIDYSTEFL